MSTINQLSAITSSQLTSGSQFVVYDTSNGDARKLPASQLLEYLNTNFSNPTFVTTISNPSDGFTINMPDNGDNQWALVEPTTALLVGTINLPAVASAVDGQECLITCKFQVATLTIGANGASAVHGAPSSFGADDNIKFRFNKVKLSWYRVA
jgi:hypothetical protein